MIGANYRPRLKPAIDPPQDKPMSTVERMTDPGLGLSPGAPTDLPSNDPSSYERIIKPSEGWIGIDWKELYHSRELFDTLILRDIRIRYKQTVFGVAWAVLQPLLSMAIFTLVFGRIPGAKPEGIPYPLFVYAGLIPWTFFSSAVTSAGTSLLGQQQLLTKIYFPRLYVPASTAGAYLVDMGIGLGLFAVLMPFYHFAPSINLIFLPFIILLTFAASFGLGLVFASMTIMFRDLRFIIPFIMSMMMFASPLFFRPEMLSSKVQFLIALNPISGIISAYRWSILGMPLDVPALLMSIVVTIVVLTFGMFFFRKTERYFADLL